jgi:tetratricopeptide (TPR) repeat protein
MLTLQRKNMVLTGLMLCFVGLAYGNHFRNGFHFDDSHAIVDNPYIRSLKNIPRFFTDADTFSVLPANRSYRPVVSVSLALDYWLAGGLQPLYFQASTFFWYLLQLLLIYALFRRICDLTYPGRGTLNQWSPLYAASLYGVHPAIAETVNYVIQRGEVYSTLGVVGGMAVYAWAPRLRHFGLYLLPVAVGQLSKPPALVFPVILLTYILLFEESHFLRAMKRCAPAFVLAGAAGVLSVAMTPESYNPGAVSPFAYRLTQPLVSLRYFRTFFIPDRLTVDTDHGAVSGLFQEDAWLGFLFVMALVLVAIWCSNRPEWRPAAFGLWWFLIALAPTAVFPLAEIENDHRMFFPFIGLALAACWPAAVWWYRHAPLTAAAHFSVASGCAVVLIALTLGTRQRNEVWHSEETLWADAARKSPASGRVLMNYGLTQMAKGEYRRALDYFERAEVLAPSYATLEINLGIVNGALNRNLDAAGHFARAIQLAPDQAISHYFYGRWLRQQRSAEAVVELRQAIALSPDYLDARYLLMQDGAERGDWGAVRTEATSTLDRFPSDASALAFLRRAQSGEAAGPKTADDYLNLSLSYYRSGQFPQAIGAAEEALRLHPRFAEAYNNIAASYQSMGRWDEGIAAARQALQLKPDFPLARNNLAWGEEQKRKAGERQTGSSALSVHHQANPEYR